MRPSPEPSGAASRPLPPSASVLVILTGSLGDVVRGLPLAAAVKAQRPDARVAWLVDARWQPLLEAHPFIDRLLVFEPSSPAGVIRSLRALRAERPDVVLDLQRHFKSGACGWVSAAPRRIGVHPANARELNHWFNNEHVPRVQSTDSKLDHYLSFLTAVGLNRPARLEFGLDALARQPLPGLFGLTGRPFVAVVMGSSWPSKDWTLDGYHGVTARLLSTGCDLVLLGDGKHAAAAADVAARAASSQRVHNLAGRTSLPQLTALLARAVGAVGPDSGPGHLAAAVGTPYVSLFGPTDPARVAPFGCERFVVRSPVDCPPCTRRRCRRKAGACMPAITAEMVWSKLGPLVDAAARH